MSAISFDVTTFRTLFPAYADPVAFPDAKLAANFDLATGYVSPDTYGDMPTPARTQALNLMTAHLTALSVIIAAGGVPGVEQSSTVGDVSVTMVPPPVRSQWAWWLNTTPYGAQMVALLDAQSVGGFYVGGMPERSAFRKAYGVF